MAITISDSWLKKIKSVAEHSNSHILLLDTDDLKDICISHAMQDYFTKFPVRSDYQVSVNGENIYPFPDAYTIGAVDCRVVDIGMIGGTGSGFWDIILFNTQTGNTMSYKAGVGVYGRSGYNPNNVIQQRENSRQAVKSQQNLYATIKFRVDRANKRLIVYNSITGMLNITWAKYSDNWDDIRYERQWDVAHLAQSYILDHFCDNAGMITDSSADTTTNISDIRQRATDLRTEVFEKWKEFPDIVVQHFV